MRKRQSSTGDKKGITTFLSSVLIIIVFNLLPYTSHAGSWNGWVYQTPYPTKSALLSVKFVTPQKGWVVGQDGTILYTKDGGETWAAQKSGTEQDLKSASFVDEKSGWAVGDGGAIIHTRDGGKTWRPQEALNVPLHKIFFVSKQEGWIVGAMGTLLHTEDGGNNWERQNIGIGRHIACIYFINPQTGWILAGDEVYWTRNGGKNWEKAKLDMKMPRSGAARRSHPLSMMSQGVPPDWSEGDIYFADKKNGWAVAGTWQIFHTSDGGKTWAARDLGYMSYGLGVISFIDKKRGCASGTSIFCTDDGGKTWKERLGVKPGEREKIDGFMISIWGQSFANKSIGWAVGAKGQILKTVDGGKSWRVKSRGYSEAYFWNSKLGWKTVRNYKKYKDSIVKTDDGGNTWKVQKEFEHRISARFFFINATTGWVVGKEWEQTNSGPIAHNFFIFHTYNGSKNWVTQFKEHGGEKKGLSNELQDVCVINTLSAWAVGANGLILHTSDGGNNWRRQRSGTKAGLWKVQFADAKRGWAIGNKVAEGGATSIVLYTNDGGKHWEIQWEKDAHWMWLSDLFFIDKNNGWIIGDSTEYGGNGILVHTVDGGKSWTEKKFREIFFDRLFFLDRSRGAVLTEKGRLLLTTDGGKTWNKKSLPLRSTPWHVSELFTKDK